MNTKLESLINLCDKYLIDKEYCFVCKDESGQYNNCIGYITLDKFVFLWSDIFDALANSRPKLKIDLCGFQNQNHLKDEEIDMLMTSIKRNPIDSIRMITY